jgi:exonuclease SbcC
MSQGKTMTNIETVRAAFSRHFQHVVEMGDGVVRGERQHNGKPYAVAYVDLSDEVVERALDLQSYQERLIGADFFSSDNDLRWNSYLFFWAGPKSAAKEEFQRAKTLIESDRHFARKFVLNEGDLERRLGQRPQVVATPASQQGDAGHTWAELLRADSLAMLLEQRPRTTTLELIEAGEAFEEVVSSSPQTKAATKDVLANGLLRKLSIQQFRRVHQKKEFDFGDVNLITAANGMGKTSLLEAIEALYCGRVRRDPEAVFEGITGVMEAPDGRQHTVELTKVPATLKARNMAWYGRADVQAQAISQGFTRFNFLDTDAAFRLSSEQDPEQIRLDLGRLIVGPETTRLWTFLSKLKEDVDTRLKALEGQRPGDELNVDFLEEEVARLEATPSESASLRTAFRLAVARLRPSWAIAEEGAPLSEQERASLVTIKSAIDRTLAAAPVTPGNKSTLQAHLAKMRSALTEAKRIHSLHESAVREANAATESLNASKEKHRLAAAWEKILLAGVPELAERMRKAEQQVQALRGVLPSYSEDAVSAFSEKFLPFSLMDAISDATRDSDLAQEASRTAQRALSQAQELGQTLVALRRDLHDAAVAVMGQTGNLTECPVCKTVHVEQDLAEKLHALIGSSDSQMSAGLRQRAQTAKQNADAAQRALEAVRTLAKWQQAAGLSENLACKEIFAQVQQLHEKLKATLLDLQEARQAERTLAATGIRLEGWQEARANAQRALSGEFNFHDKARLRQAIELMAVQDGIGALANILTSNKPLTLAKNATELAISIGESTGASMVPSQVVVAVERRVQQAEARVAAGVEIEKAIDWPADTSYETLLSEVQACLLAYDKAAHAATHEAQADSVLKQKRKDLAAAQARNKKHEVVRQNLTRAATTLSKIVDGHSLEDVTSDTLSTIRSKVSDVFSQIHSPPEYALGNFNDGQLIVRRDDGTTHAVNQVSTGQRAALALSIFLALNESAGTAPPVILIDDPVAHIDDLNALSFIDYLRDLVVSSRKQVFFATADARLAALFQRKFEFLGPERYRRISLDTAQTAHKKPTESLSADGTS